jgi:hypothetical protein
MLLARTAVVLTAAGANLLAPAAQRTHPHVRPRSGGPATAFDLTFTPRSTPGHTGLFATDYRIGVSPVRHLSVPCQPPEPASIVTGGSGQIERVTLSGPAGGWCRGRYTATVYLERGPYCPPPAAYGMPVPCPEFATQELDTGTARFTVR